MTRTALACLIALLLTGCMELRAAIKCGPDGTVDWDANPNYPPPHCNKDRT